MVRLARAEVFDPVSGKNFDHRKVWLELSLVQFAAAFGIDLLGFAILSNHFHLILRSRPDVVATWDDREVARRWLMLCPHRRKPDGSPMDPTDPEIHSIAGCPVKLTEIRKRLSSISWWMRHLGLAVGPGFLLLCRSTNSPTRSGRVRASRMNDAATRVFYRCR